MDVYLHSYTFRNEPFETAVQYAKHYGYDGVELSLVHCRDTHVAEDLPRCTAIAERHGVPITCVDFRGAFVSDDERAAYDSVGHVENTIAACAAEGINRMNGFTGFLGDAPRFGDNGSAIATDEHYRRAADSLRHLADTAAKHDIALCIEIHMNTIHDSVASTKRLLDLVPSVNVLATPDPGNMFATSTAERDPVSLKAIADRIGYVHLKNCRAIGDDFDYAVRLSDGHIDTVAWLRRLRKLEYAGPLCIEYVGEGDPRAATRADIAYLRDSLELLDEGLH